MLRLRLHYRIFLIVLAVVIPFATLTFVAVDRKISRQAEGRLREDLREASAACDEARRERHDDLDRATRLVAELPYFKAAVSVYDPTASPALQLEQVATIRPMAIDILASLGFDFLALADTTGAVVLALRPDEPMAAPGGAFRALVARSAAAHGADGCLEVDGALYQVVLAPMEAAGLPLGHLALGRRLDDRFAGQIRRMTRTEVTILGRGAPVARCCGATDLGRARDLARQAGETGFRRPPAGESALMSLGGGHWLTLWVPIADPDGAEVGAYVLQTSLDAALAHAREIRSLMVVIWAMALLAALFLSFILARQLTRPIDGVVRASARVAAGDFTAQVPVTGGPELATLSRSFNRMNEALCETQAQLLQAGKMAALGELGAGLAHELNQPLTSVKGFAQLALSRLETDSPQRRPLGLIVQSVDHMSRIVSGLRSFARQSKFEFGPTDVNQVVSDTALFLEAQLRNRRIRLTQRLVAGLPPVRGDANQLQQVLTNLLGNARDALDGRAEPAITVETSARGRGRYVAIRVRDNGPGVPVAIRESIFRSFFTTKESGQGTGLGLSISRGIAGNHGGRLDVFSPRRGGAVFWLVLPADGTAGRGAQAPGDDRIRPAA